MADNSHTIPGTLGIDFGTSNSAAAWRTPDGTSRLLALENGAEGIGLLRTEFIFLKQSEMPSEDEQVEANRKVGKGMEGWPVTIRTFDLGNDKQVPTESGDYRRRENPALGLRSIRL